MAKNLVLAKAQNAVMAHDWPTAARLYKELLHGNESNVDYLTELGNIYVKAGEDEKAIPYYEQIITFYPHYIAAMNSLGAIYRRLKQYEKSISILQRALEENRDKGTVNYNLGFTYKEMGNYNDAIDAFESVINDNPDDVLAYNHLGSIYYAQKDYGKSIASFRRGLQVDPNHPILNYNLARCYEADKNITDAIRCYETTLKTRPGWTDAIRDFSHLLIKSQQNKKAQQLVEKSIKLHPSDAELLCILGRIFINQYDFDNAAKTYKRADSVKGSDIKILVGFSEALEKGAKVEEALDKALEAIEIDPYNADVRKQYVSTLLSNQRYDQAYENLIALKDETKEKDPQTLDLCAQYYICRGDEANAKEYHEKIQKIDQHYKDYMLSASDRYVQIGNLEKAQEYAQKYIECRNKYPGGYNRLGRIFQAQGDMKKAKLYYEKGKQYCEPNVQADTNLRIINKEIEDNPEKYSFETPAIEVDVQEVENAEDYVPSSFIGEVVGQENQEETASTENFDYDQFGSEEPMDEALLEKEDDFWKEFDDDPNAEQGKLLDEESEEEEHETEDDTSEIFDTFGNTADSDIKNPIVEDSDNLDDIANSLGDESFMAEPDSVEEPEIMENPENYSAEAVVPESKNPNEPVYEPPRPSYQQPYDSGFDRQMQSFAMNSADKAMDAAFTAQKMVQQLADQQKQLIKDEVEKVVDQKLQSSIDSQMERIMDAGDDFMDIGENNNEILSETKDSVIENIESEPETAEKPMPVEEPVPGEEPEVVHSGEGTTAGEEDYFTDVEEFANEQDVNEEDYFTTVEDYSGEEAEPVEMFIDSVEEDCFGQVDDFTEENEVPAEENVELPAEEDFDSVENYCDEQTSGTVQNDSDITEEEDFDTVENYCDEESEVNVDAAAISELTGEEKSELELFKTLRVLSNFLPANKKNSFLSCRIRMIIEYIIARLSGRKGLLVTAETLIQSGALGEEFRNKLTDAVEDDLSNEMISHVLKYMKKLAVNLEDENLSKALCISADNILERIELENQKSQIF